MLEYDVCTHTKHWKDLSQKRICSKHTETFYGADSAKEEDNRESRARESSKMPQLSPDERSSLSDMERDVDCLLVVLDETYQV